MKRLHQRNSQIDYDTAKKAPVVVNDEGKEVYPIKICGKTYTDRKSGGGAIKQALLSSLGALTEGKTVELGEYRGLRLTASMILSNSERRTPTACLEGEKPHYCDLNMDTDIGNITRLDNCIENILSDINMTQSKIDTMASDLEKMKIDAEKPFPRADELMEAETRLEEVHEALTKFDIEDGSKGKDVYDMLCVQFPEIMSGKKESVRYEAGECFMPLVVELHDDILTMEHYYIQEGDRMYDPLITMRVDYENETVIPLDFEQSNMGIYERYSEENPTPQEIKQRNDVLDFLADTWLDNIADQGYKPVSEQEKQNNRNTDDMSI